VIQSYITHEVTRQSGDMQPNALVILMPHTY